MIHTYFSPFLAFVLIAMILFFVARRADLTDIIVMSRVFHAITDAMQREGASYACILLGMLLPVERGQQSFTK